MAQRSYTKNLKNEIDDSPYVLVHGDLSAANIIVDQNFQVESYVKRDSIVYLNS